MTKIGDSNNPMKHSDNPHNEKSLKNSFTDGLFSSAMTGFTQDYFTPFLLVIGGTARQVGILSSLPNLAAALIQLNAPDITHKIGSRRRVINIFVFLQVLMLIPITLIAFEQIKNPNLFILCVTLFTTMGAIALPPWGSMMADMVEEKRRGEYFGWRNRIFGTIIVGFSMLAGTILHFMQGINIFHGFAIIFASASLFRLVSWYFLTRMHEPPQIKKKEDEFTFWMFISRFRQSNFAQFVIFVAILNFTINLASPFFAVYMLRDLKFDYLTYTFITVTAQITIFYLMIRWGRHADRVGNLKVIQVTTKIIALLPLLWIVCSKPWFLFLVQLSAGFVWAGFNLCTTNFIYDAVTPVKRTRCIAYFNTLNGCALCGGALLGGFLIDKLPNLFGYQVLTLFFLSALLRSIVAWSLSWHLKEVRSVEKIHSHELFFSMLGVKPILGAMNKPNEI